MNKMLFTDWFWEQEIPLSVIIITVFMLAAVLWIIDHQRKEPDERRFIYLTGPLALLLAINLILEIILYVKNTI